MAERPRVIVFNGGSSSGKTTLTLALQEALLDIWLRLGVDALVDAAPPRLLSAEGLDLAADGSVRVGAAFATTEDQWMAGIARMAEVGAQILVEDGFVSGPTSQQRWRRALEGVPVGWVGVHCDPATAERRELARGDRTVGMAAQQADAVHVGIVYDLEVDTTDRDPAALADDVVERWFR